MLPILYQTFFFVESDELIKKYNNFCDEIKIYEFL